MTAITRLAAPADAADIAAVLAEAFNGYRSWAPREWTPRVPTVSEEVNRLADALARPDVWCLLALDGPEVVGHVAFSAVTMEDPESPPPGTINLWQLFVRPAWQGRGLAKRLMEAALEEARLPGLYSRAAVDSAGRGGGPAASMSGRAGARPEMSMRTRGSAYPWSSTPGG